MVTVILDSQMSESLTIFLEFTEAQMMLTNPRDAFKGQSRLLY